MQRAEIQSPRRGARKPRIVHQVDAPHRAQPGRKRPAADDAGRDGEMLALRPREEGAIGGPEHRGLRPDIVVGQIDMRAFVDREQGRGHRDMRALSALLAAIERGHDCDAGIKAGEQVGDRDARSHRSAARLAVGQAGDAHHPAHALDDEVVAGTVGIGSVLPEAGDRCVDQPRIALRQGFVVEAEEAERARAKILDHDISSVAEFQRQIIGAGDVQVDADVAFSGVLLRVVARHAVGRRKRKARHVEAWRFDLDDLGAEILQCPRAQGTREHAGEINDTNSAERAAHDQRPANLARPGPFLRNEARPVFRSSEAQIGA